MNLLNLSRNELEAFFLDLGEKRFRAEQVYQWIWAKRAGSFEEMTNLSKELRGKLVRKASLFRPRPVQVKASKDGTVKFLLELEDRALVESVLIPGEGRYTQCLSTQVGCAMGCTFCATGTMGLTRNMTAGEIMSQILVGRDYLADKGLSPLKNLVFMGMGEPLDNLDQVIRALEGIRDPGGLNISNRRMTVSTVGLPGPLERLGTTGLALPAVSLHAPTQQLRARIMPKAARVPLDELLGVLKNYPLRPRERITFEYLLLGGVNDSLDHARKLVSVLNPLRCKVNLIAYNPSGKAPYRKPTPQQVLAFETLLRDKGMTALIRRSMGSDIQAACGQLKAQSSLTG